MNYALVPLSQLDDESVNRLAALHHSVMHTLLSDLGLPMVLRYYQLARHDPSAVSLCAVAPSGEMLGWALGSPSPEQIISHLRKPFTRFISQMLRVAFARPLVLWQLCTSFLISSSHLQMEDRAIELTYIGVASHQRSKGLGQRLLRAFLDESRSRGYHSVLLSVETENKPAIALYEKAGFKIVKSYSEGRYQRHRMELILA